VAQDGRWPRREPACSEACRGARRSPARVVVRPHKGCLGWAHNQPAAGRRYNRGMTTARRPGATGHRTYTAAPGRRAGRAAGFRGSLAAVRAAPARVGRRLLAEQAAPEAARAQALKPGGSLARRPPRLKPSPRSGEPTGSGSGRGSARCGTVQAGRIGSVWCASSATRRGSIDARRFF
jgi:hypothetical protein